MIRSWWDVPFILIALVGWVCLLPILIPYWIVANAFGKET